MKYIYVCKKECRIVAALVVAVVICICTVMYNTTVYAGNIVITGDSAGALRVTSADNMLFDLNGLYPGDSSISSVTISNTDMENDGFELFMYANNKTKGEYDLGRVTKLTITDGDTTIYDDMLIDFDERSNAARPIALGRIEKGTSKELGFAVEVDGAKADNNYQNQQSNFVVTFVANSYGTPEVPPGGGGGGGGSRDRGGGTPFTPETAPEESGIIVETFVEVEPESESVPLGPLEAEQLETIVPEAEEIPSGAVELAPEELITQEEEDTPFGTIKEMPKTGEYSLALYIVSGAAIICFGIYICLYKAKNERKKGE